MRSLPKADDCIFCGNSDIAPEHVFSRGWLRRLWDLPKKGAGLLHQHSRASTDPADETFDYWWKKNEADLVAHCVCGSCNSGWMNTLDRRVQRIIDPMTRGEPGVVRTLREKYLLAAWAMKIAFMYDWQQEMPTLPADLAREFFDGHREPPSCAWIWLARSVPIVGGENHQASGAHHSAGDEFYLLTFRVDELIIQVLITPGVEVQPNRRRTGDAVIQLWPMTFETIQWPPKRTLNAVEYAAFTRSFLADYRRFGTGRTP